MSRLLRSGPLVDPFAWQDLMGMAFVAIAELDAAGKLAGKAPGQIVIAVQLDVIDALRTQNGRKHAKAHVHAVSLDHEHTLPNGMPTSYLLDLIDPAAELELHRGLDADDARAELERVEAKRLTRTERRVLRVLRDDGTDLTLMEIGDRIGVSEGRVSQVLKQLRSRFPKAA